MRATILIGAFAIGALIGLSPAAHADPFSPYCDPSRRDYNSKVCASSPANDVECAEFGHLDACQEDYQDVQRWRHQLSPTQN